MPCRIAIGADHAGYGLKEALVRHLAAAGYEVRDLGTHSTASVDFPILAASVARAVAGRGVDRGILVDGAGSPSAMVANKFPGIRCAVAHDRWTAQIAREHADTNCLALGARVIGVELAREVVDLWLATGFLGGKYQKRIDQVAAIEKEVHASERVVRRLVTDRSVAESLAEGKEIVLGPGTIVTPAARERLRLAARAPVGKAKPAAK